MKVNKTKFKIVCEAIALTAVALVVGFLFDPAVASEVERHYNCNDGVVVQDLTGNKRLIYPQDVKTSTYKCTMTSRESNFKYSTFVELYIEAKNKIVPRFSTPTDRSVAAKNRVIRLVSGELGHKFVIAKINGQEFKLMLDTGCSDIAIKKSSFRRIASRTAKLEDSYAETAAGRFPIEVFTVDIDVQGIKLSGLRMAVLPQMSDDRIDGLIGMGFLGQFDSFSVDRRNNTLTLGNRRVGR